MDFYKHRIGIMGGTFDPIHIGHLILGEAAYEQLGLEKVLYMPSGNPPHKQHREGRASDLQRTEMVKLAISGNPHFELSLMEMHEEGYTYTYRTLETLRSKNPDTEYCFIIGADSLFQFHTWMQPQRICDACTLAVAVRDNVSMATLRKAVQETEDRFHTTIEILHTTNLDISSNMLRDWVHHGRSIRYYVPEQVREYILQNGIYDSQK